LCGPLVFGSSIVEIITFRRIGDVLGRTPGAKNKTPREIRNEAAAKMKEAKLKQRIADKNKKIADLQKKKAAAKK
jgi:hypothetical protein